MKKNPKVLLLTSRNIDYDDCEYEVSGISYYYIIPAGKLIEVRISYQWSPLGLVLELHSFTALISA